MTKALVVYEDCVVDLVAGGDGGADWGGGPYRIQKPVSAFNTMNIASFVCSHSFDTFQSASATIPHVLKYVHAHKIVHFFGDLVERFVAPRVADRSTWLPVGAPPSGRVSPETRRF
ncbi:unnamed protein product [Calypogeia fissa]